ncbi:hypothetical protein JKF63_00749 [Porcisia hertigi]|uniref:Rab-GAP TBC domain-containing protein n=1 Tax=Porcisia hertigi TaxID=2761500 RepID=A0A836L784_9TRYP|nr:hypothetical protein JKF63_00749 [Porcisia hertigi]
MTVSITSSTVVDSLWAPEDVGAIPLHASGQFLALVLSPTAALANNTVTSVAFHPVDETCFVLGTEAGRAYGVSLQENKLFLLGDVGERGALRCATFCPGYLTSPIVVFACSDNRLIFLDWKRGVVLQDVPAAAHDRPILGIVTGASTESLFCTLSADAISCWEPLANSDTAYAIGSLSSAPLASSHQGSFNTAGEAGPLPNGRSTYGSSMPRYGCTGSALPTQCTLQLQEKDDLNANRLDTVMHRFLGVHILHPALLVSVETSGVLSLWSRTAVAADGDPVAQRTPLQLQKSATTPSVLRVRTSVQCGTLIALGADAATADELRDQLVPAVAFIAGQTLEGAGMVRLPARGTGGYTKDRAVTVYQLSALHSDCVACLLSTGVVHVVLPSTFHLVFSIPPPSVGNPAQHFSPRSSWNFTPSGPTLGAMWREHLLILLHLPTAHHGDLGTAPVFEPAVLRAGSMMVSSTEVIVNKERSSAKSKAPQLGNWVDDPSTAATNSTVVVAQSFLRPCKAAQMKFSLPLKTADAVPSAVDAALAVLSFCRPHVVVPPKGLPESWADVNEVDLCFMATEITDRRFGGSKEKDKRTTTTSPVAWSSTAAFCDTLCASSCQYNLNQLQAHLLKYGVYPHQYRTAIWRFLAGLPSKAKTASQFAALARRPVHLGVSQLMAPFPLPPSGTRDAVEMALSCLCWASPVFTLASYLPVLVYPLSMIFQDDVQGVVELVLMFFLNWGKDFFVCHPHGPATLLMAMEHELRRLDAQLCQHLDAIGAGVAVWGWELLTTFFTDCLTGPEWVQLMDHTFTASPLWLFAFHVTLVRTRLRSELSTALSVEEVRRVLRSIPMVTASPQASSPTKSLKGTIEETYRLHHRWSRESFDLPANFAGFKVFQTLTTGFAYPSNFTHDSVILAQKLHELSVLQSSRDEEKKAAAYLDGLRKTAEVSSSEDAAFLQQQRARMTAKYDASAASWQAHVALERSRQERDEEERKLRWDALQKQTRNAEELESLRAEMNMMESQLRHDMVDRHMEELKWRLAAHLSDEELMRLQKDADAQVELAVRRISEDERRHAEDTVEFRAAPLLLSEALPKEEDDTQAEVAAAQRSDDQGPHPLAPLQPTAVLADDESNQTREMTLRHSGDLIPTPEEGLESAETLEASGSVVGSSQLQGMCALSNAQSSGPSSALSCKGSPAVSHAAACDAGLHLGGRPQHRKDTTHPLEVVPSPTQAPMDHPCDEDGGGDQRSGVLENAVAHRKVDRQKGRRRYTSLPRHDYRDPSEENHKIAHSQQRFLELRNRVLGRRDPDPRPKESGDPLRRYRPPCRGDGSTTVTSDSTPTMTATASYPSSYAVPCSGRRLYDNYEPGGRSCGVTKCSYNHHRCRHLKTPLYPYSDTTTTITAGSASQEQTVSVTTTGSSYDSLSRYTSQGCVYSTATSTLWRSGESPSMASTTSVSSSHVSDTLQHHRHGPLRENHHAQT